MGECLPQAGRLVWLHAFTAHVGVEQAAGPKRDVAQHLGVEPVVRAASPEFVLGIVHAVAPRGALAEGAAVHHEPQHVLEIPASVVQLDGQPIEQLRVGRLLSLQAKILRRANQPRAEDALPDAVDQHTGDDRLLAAGEPLGQAKPVARCALGEGVHRLEHVRLQRLTGGQVVLAAIKQSGLARLGQVLGNERGGESGCGVGALLDELPGLGLQTKLGQAALRLGQVGERLTRLGSGLGQQPHVR